MGCYIYSVYYEYIRARNISEVKGFKNLLVINRNPNAI